MIITDIPYITIWRGDAKGVDFTITLTHRATARGYTFNVVDTTPHCPLMAFTLPTREWERMADGEYSYVVTASDGAAIANGIMTKRGERAKDVEHNESRTYVEYKR